VVRRGFRNRNLALPTQVSIWPSACLMRSPPGLPHTGRLRVRRRCTATSKGLYFRSRAFLLVMPLITCPSLMAVHCSRHNGRIRSPKPWRRLSPKWLAFTTTWRSQRMRTPSARRAGPPAVKRPVCLRLAVRTGPRGANERCWIRESAARGGRAACHRAGQRSHAIPATRTRMMTGGTTMDQHRTARSKLKGKSS